MGEYEYVKIKGNKKIIMSKVKEKLVKIGEEEIEPKNVGFVFKGFSRTKFKRKALPLIPLKKGLKMDSSMRAKFL